jgi:hypothetical protein
MEKETIKFAKAILMTRKLWQDSWIQRSKNEDDGEFKLMPPEAAEIVCKDLDLDIEIAHFLSMIVNNVSVWRRVKEWADNVLLNSDEKPIEMSLMDYGT